MYTYIIFSITNKPLERIKALLANLINYVLAEFLKFRLLVSASRNQFCSIKERDYTIKTKP